MHYPVRLIIPGRRHVLPSPLNFMRPEDYECIAHLRMAHDQARHDGVALFLERCHLAAQRYGYATPAVSLKVLLQELGAPHPRSGTYTHNACPGGMALSTDSSAYLVAVANRSRCVIKYGEELPPFYFRGQTVAYTGGHGGFLPCTASIYRETDFAKRMLAIAHTVTFEQALTRHDCIRAAAADPRLRRVRFAINYTGIAQHYGFATPLLDITSSLEVAAFFASCSLKDGRYEPVPSGGIGVLCIMTSHDPHLCERVRIIGWQPLQRPDAQHAYALRAAPGWDLNQERGDPEMLLRAG